MTIQTYQELILAQIPSIIIGSYFFFGDVERDLEDDPKIHTDLVVWTDATQVATYGGHAAVDYVVGSLRPWIHFTHIL